MVRTVLTIDPELAERVEGREGGGPHEATAPLLAMGCVQALRCRI